MYPSPKTVEEGYKEEEEKRVRKWKKRNIKNQLGDEYLIYLHSKKK